MDKYQPDQVDLRNFKRAAKEGRLDEYWASHADQLERLTGSREPPKIGAAPAAARTRATAAAAAATAAAVAVAPAVAPAAATAQNA